MTRATGLACRVEADSPCTPIRLWRSKGTRMGERGQGPTHARTVEVTDTLTAIEFGSGDVPVLATPAVLALAEGTCVELHDGRLDAGETSVGTFAEIEHTKGTPVGGTVVVEASLVGQDGRQLEFEVVVREGDEQGEVVATVRHRRAIVDRQRFLERMGASDA